MPTATRRAWNRRQSQHREVRQALLRWKADNKPTTILSTDSTGRKTHDSAAQSPASKPRTAGPDRQTESDLADFLDQLTTRLAEEESAREVGDQ